MAETFLFRQVYSPPKPFTFVPDDSSAAPGYEYTKSGADWTLKILTSGTLTLGGAKTVDLFAVGGGGSGGATSSVTGGVSHSLKRSFSSSLCSRCASRTRSSSSGR